MKKYLLLLATAFISLSHSYGQNAATPNAGFETWTNHSSSVSYDDANGWNDLNSTTAGFGVVTCFKATAAADIHGGSAAMKLTTQKVLGQNANGIATTGNINTSSQAITGGIAYTGHPDSIVGFYKSSPVSTDHGFFQLMLLGSSNTDTVGYVRFNTPTTAVNTYTRFSAPVLYKNSHPVATSQWLLSSSFGASGQQVNSTVFVDDLDLIFNPNGIQEEELLSGFHVGPIPAQNTLTVFNSRGTPAYIEFYEITGRKLFITPVNNASNSISLDNLHAGVCLYTIFDQTGKPLNNGKVIVQK